MVQSGKTLIIPRAGGTGLLRTAANKQQAGYSSELIDIILFLQQK